ncbi:ABC transporter ATP-binding protein [Enterococcus saccharolyticus]|uniref:Peptide ABC transporter n=1 Tax=Candidatus Enterococcus willemsii TaxID=1857215 RepID=A0ABQ6Z0L0_9ENTE|nr:MULTISPECIES: ABC transporter ATP-binding protein [Enterococcus]KAF1304557.1 peptide ABC transporter [Enterococcus sp. CU12B]MCD5001291.1 ABC transporter ATP-binding protein [Enterococcus saccharolyticus]
MTEEILTMTNLHVTIQAKKHPALPIIKGIDLHIPKGKVVGIVGESGSGKSIAMKSLMDILPDNAHATFDQFLFAGQAVTDAQKIPLAMIFQDPMTSLNPLRTIGYHLVEVILRHQKISKKQAQQRAIEELEKVGIPLPEKRMKQFPHELSGGMRQRVMIAMALLAQPQLLIADEPTTALDVTIQAQILALMKELQTSESLSVILVTHDFGVVAGMCDFVNVMYQGRIVEKGTVEEIFYQAQHPYTKQLLAAAHLGDRDAPLRTVNADSYADEQVVKKELSATHHVWLKEGNE